MKCLFESQMLSGSFNGYLGPVGGTHEQQSLNTFNKHLSPLRQHHCHV